MKKLFFIALLLSFAACQTRYKSDIRTYVKSLKRENQSAKHYIEGLWKDKDLVVLCERNHNEMTQYDLIEDIISSDYFIEHVGHIFIEVGSVSVQNRVSAFLSTTYANDADREKDLIEIYRDFSWPVWEKSNTYFFLLNINKLNGSLATEKKIKLFTVDEPTPPKDIQSKEEYLAFRKQHLQLDRDSVMAMNIIHEFDSIVSDRSDLRKKCLVIMNYRHAFTKNVNNFSPEDNEIFEVFCTGAILNKYYHNKVASVYINSLALSSKLNRQIPVQNGKWDAAFKVAEKENIGFNFAGSPFGRDSLDIWPYSLNYTYQDIFTGFVYYLPLDKHINAKGLNNFLTPKFEEELYQRLLIYTKVYGGTISKEDLKNILKYREDKRPLPEADQKTIDQWLSK